MIAEGQIVLFRFPQTDQQSGKLRPAPVVRKLPGRYEDWLISMSGSTTPIIFADNELCREII